jgi:hypothetical protein
MIINSVPLILTATCITSLAEFLLLFLLLLIGNKRSIEEKKENRGKKEEM